MNKRVILDTNVLISALIRKDSPPAQVLDYAIDQCIILTSIPCLDEIKAKLYLPKFAKYFSQEEADLLLETFSTVAELISITENVDACRDPKDNKFLELGVSSQADFIVSGDPDLLVLHPFRTIRILKPVEFLEMRTN